MDTPGDWNAPSRPKLWLYNLHYFDDLSAAEAANRADWHRSLIDHWIAQNQPGQGNGWEPYPLSLRLVNWIKWALDANDLRAAWRHSLAVQTRFLRQRLEWHLLGNHLLANAKALIFAGVFFEGDEAQGWLNTGLSILARELPEQILIDGGHFELSPMYHSIILEDVLDLINLARTYTGAIPEETVAIWLEIAMRMRAWLAAMTHPDGEMSFLNDAAFGIASSPGAIENYARRLSLTPCIKPQAGATQLASSGYFRAELGEAVALFDTANIGPDYLPGHAHADTLSFELSLSAQRVIVNSGISEYGAGPERLRQRSTAAHNTVEIDGENSSEVWGGFRVARRAYPRDLDIHETEKCLSIACSHDGYHRLPGRPTHRRKWRLDADSLSIHDSIQGEFTTASARFHFHPDVAAEGDETGGILTLADGQKIHWEAKDGTAKIRPGVWHPEFGLSIQNQCLEISFKSSDCTTTFSW